MLLCFAEYLVVKPLVCLQQSDRALPPHTHWIPLPSLVPPLWVSCCPISLPWVRPLPLHRAVAEPAPAQPRTAAPPEQPCVLSSLMQTCAAVRIPLFSHLTANISAAALESPLAFPFSTLTSLAAFGVTLALPIAFQCPVVFLFPYFSVSTPF